MGEIKILEIRSEIGAGTRGASLGIEALKTAALNVGNLFFYHHETEEIPNENKLLYHPVKFNHARYIEGMVKIYNRLSRKVTETLKKGQYPLILSGDHASAGATIAGIKSAYPELRLGIVWMDAHADLHTPYTTPSGNVHGMPLAAALNEDNLSYKKREPDTSAIKYWNQLKQSGNITPKIFPHDIIIIAARDCEKEEEALIKTKGIHTITVKEVRKKGAPSIARQTLEKLGTCDLIYLSFDVDSLDPNLSTGTGTPVKEGLWKEEAEQLIVTLLQDPRVCCFELTEINPTLDTKNKMAEMAFDILAKGAEKIKQQGAPQL